MKEGNSRVRIKAHPTRYARTLFRSRLEARWAAFFDLAGWQWLYEPADDEGWVPDFILPKSGLVIEVKPIEWPSMPMAMLTILGRRDCDKVRFSNRIDRLILGAYPLQTSWNSTFLGVYLGERADAPVAFPPIGTVFMYEIVLDRARYDLTTGYEQPLMWFGCGKSVVGGWDDRKETCFDNAMDLWREAGNRVQWRGGAKVKLGSLFDD